MLFRNLFQSVWSVGEHRWKQNFLPYLQRGCNWQLLLRSLPILPCRNTLSVNMRWTSLFPITDTAARSWSCSRWGNWPASVQADVCTERERGRVERWRDAFFCLWIFSFQRGDPGPSDDFLFLFVAVKSVLPVRSCPGAVSHYVFVQGLVFL